MLAAHDQENRLFGRSVGGASGKQQTLQPKTPGAKFPKTPMKKMPFDEQNGATRLAGRPRGGIENMQQTIGKGGKGMVTPLEPRTARAPLGNKTTNAKAQTLQQHQQQQQKLEKQAQGVKDRVREIEKSQLQPPAQPATARRARVISPRASPFKLSVLSDATAIGSSGNGGQDDDIEYAPPAVAARPYESDVFPDGALSYTGLRPENRLQGYYDHYYNPIGADGRTRRDKELAEQQRRAFEKLDISVQDDLDSLDWSISDVPASRGFVPRKKTTKVDPAPVQPPTIAARNAAAALARTKTDRTLKTARAVATKPGHIRVPSASSIAFLSGLPLRKGVPAKAPLAMRPKNSSNPAAEAASRTTLGYNKGRSALSMVRGSGNRPTVGRSAVAATASRPRSAAGPSAASVPVAVTPVRKTRVDADTVESAGSDVAELEKTPAFLSIFDVEEADELGGAATVINEDLDDDFQLDVGF